ncbi:dihydroorotate dehydrogenase [Synergistales bacterium]|nr:dihydroorotate dehydrogenase [Synergistales bacterium]
MSKILSNHRMNEDFYLMRAEHQNDARPGQFYMLRAWGREPVLSRPISVFDADGDTVSFLYKVVGRGSAIFASLSADDEITLQGPLGNGFPNVTGKVAMVGGGVGIAPFYLAGKRLKASGVQVSIYLGFSGEPVLVSEYERAAGELVVKVGGFITDSVEPSDYDSIFACGPEVMMRSLYKKCKERGAADNLFVSMENRMACGVGACLVCSCKTADGNKKVCKDGPVFKGEAVFGL